MPVNSQHPQYLYQVDDWTTMRDAIEGLKALRANITRYLPVPPGLTATNIDLNSVLRGNTVEAQSRYAFYASFAEYPEIVADTIEGIQGLVHEKPAQVDLPPELEYLVEYATPDGLTLQDLWQKVTREALSVGRVELLAEIYEKQTTGDTLLCLYTAESLINWRVATKIAGGGALLAVFEECRKEQKEADEYELEDYKYYRELKLFQTLDAFKQPVGASVYKVRVWRAEKDKAPVVEAVQDADAEGWVEVKYLGKTREFLPITVINAISRGFDFGPIPMLAGARRALSIFRKSADYFRSLYQKGDPQPWVSGVSKDDVPGEIGGGTVWAFSDPNAKAGYLDIDGDGIPLMKGAIDDQYARFAIETGQLLDSDDGGQAKSGEALRREAANGRVTIKGVIINTAAGVQDALRSLARLRGMSDDVIEKIFFTPNTDFSEPMMTGREVVDYVLAKTGGGPISWRTIHAIMFRHKVTDLTFEEEMDEIASEVPTAEVDPVTGHDKPDPNDILTPPEDGDGPPKGKPSEKAKKPAPPK